MLRGFEMNKYRCESVRLCRYLYSLGFDKQSIEYNDQEAWLFDKSNELQESLDFYFSMRKKLKELRLNIKGANDNVNRKTTLFLD
jgi:hypothetical protein|nr:MAG TPA: hypothetical protein [Caudoviricetes sp.]